MKFAKRYTLTPYDAARQQIRLANPHLAEPVRPVLAFGDPLPAVRGSVAELLEGGVVVWQCAHKHRSTEGALACAWRERGVRMAATADADSDS